MNTDLNKTINIKPHSLEKNRKWYKIDAKGQTLGRLAVKIAKIMIGKHKSYYSDAWDAGDFVIIENAEKISVTGNKLEDKIYYRHSGYKGSLKESSLEDLLNRHPERAVYYAVQGMLPKNKLRKHRMKRLKITAGKSTKYDYLSPQKI